MTNGQAEDMEGGGTPALGTEASAASRARRNLLLNLGGLAAIVGGAAGGAVLGQFWKTNPLVSRLGSMASNLLLTGGGAGIGGLTARALWSGCQGEPRITYVDEAGAEIVLSECDVLARLDRSQKMATHLSHALEQLGVLMDTIDERDRTIATLQAGRSSSTCACLSADSDASVIASDREQGGGDGWPGADPIGIEIEQLDSERWVLKIAGERAALGRTLSLEEAEDVRHQLNLMAAAGMCTSPEEALRRARTIIAAEADAS